MGLDVENLSKAIWQDAVDTWEELQKIRCTLINIKISTAKIQSQEAMALMAVANEIEKAIIGISRNTARIRDNAKKIGKYKINQDDGESFLEKPTQR